MTNHSLFSPPCLKGVSSGVTRSSGATSVDYASTNREADRSASRRRAWWRALSTASVWLSLVAGAKGALHAQEIQNDPSVFVNRLANGLTYYAKENPWPEKTVQIRIVFRAGTGRAGVADTDVKGDIKVNGDTLIATRVGEAALGMGPPPHPIVSVDHDATVLSAATASDSASVWNALGLIASRIKSPPEGLSPAESSYYKKWFSPDNMAVIITGDITVKDAEAWMNYHFWDLTRPEEPLETLGDVKGDTTADISALEGHQQYSFMPLVQESAEGSIDILYSIKPTDGTLAERFRQNLLSTFFTNILSQRIGELKGRTGALITRGNAQYLAHTANGNILQVSIGFDDDSAASASLAYHTLVKEVASVIKDGITQEELVLWQEMLRPNYASEEEPPPSNSAVAADQYVNHFLHGDIYATPAQEKPWVADIIDYVTVEDLKNVAKRLLDGARLELQSTVSVETGNRFIAQYDSIVASTIKSLKDSSQPVQYSGFKIVDLTTDGDRPFQELLIEEIKKGDDLGLTPVVEFGAIWCLPCRLVDVSLKHPKMQDAFKGVYLIRVDIEIWEDELQEAHFPIQSVPAFFATSLDGKPTGAVQFGANSGDLNSKAGELNNAFAENAAPGFKAFFAKCREEFLASKGGE